MRRQTAVAFELLTATVTGREMLTQAGMITRAEGAIEISG
jgi:hypothetical protein